MEKKGFCFCSLFEVILVHHSKGGMTAGSPGAVGACNGDLSSPHMLAEQDVRLLQTEVCP